MDLRRRAIDAQPAPPPLSANGCSMTLSAVVCGLREGRGDLPDLRSASARPGGSCPARDLIGERLVDTADRLRARITPLRRSAPDRPRRRRTRRSRRGPPSPPACGDCLFLNRIHGVNPWCPSGVSVNTCSRRRAPSGIRSLPAWASPSSQPSSRTGGRPRPSSWSLPRCAFPSCCNGGGGSRLQPFAKKQHCSTQPSTSWTQPSMSSSSEMIPRAQRLSRR